jgi:predicted signal transduction protein with EAL and GGDEF domain
VAEQTGLISSLTTYVLSEALRQLRIWLDEGRDLSVAVNLSARNLMDPRLPELVAALLATAGVDPRRLEVEVTETSAMADPTRAAAVLRGLADLGVTVAVDDYGTGYSSLSYLRSLPIATLKIDRSFVTRMLQDEGSAVIVRSTIELARNLGLKVVAEGVEDAGHLCGAGPARLPHRPGLLHQPAGPCRAARPDTRRAERSHTESTSRPAGLTRRTSSPAAKRRALHAARSPGGRHRGGDPC